VNTEARRWLREADEELAVARALRERADLPPRAACLHAPLSAEKAIKAALIERAVTLRRSHDLFEIVGLLPDDDAALIDEGDLELLNPWAIEGRYPADLGDVTADRVDAVVAAAGRVVTSITSQLT
jgi:HEPN domain-containing protein